MVSGWFIALALAWVYVLSIVWLVRSGRMEKWGLGLLGGFILMIRTQRGRNALEWLARPKRFWNVFGDLGVVVAYLGMAGMTVLMILILPTVLDPGSDIEPLRASEILVIPGVNPFVPLWYGIIALIVTLVVHEGGHGVLALANRMRLRSLGLLYAVVPIGAFVEPDEDDLAAAPRRSRLRVYAAGPTVNLVVALGTLLLFAGMLGAAVPIPGAPVASVVAGQPAEEAGIVPGDILVSADGAPLGDWTAFTEFMDTKAPGDTVLFGLHDGRTVNVTLGDQWSRLDDGQKQEIIRENATLAETLQGTPFLGVRTLPFPIQDVLTHPFGGGGAHFLFAIGMPIGEVRGAPYMSFYLPEFHETPFDGTLFWPLATTVFWVFWINLMVGLTNILPLAILDGGHLFRDGLDGLMERIRPAMEKEARERFVLGVARVMSLVIFSAFLLQIIGPRFVAAFV